MPFTNNWIDPSKCFLSSALGTKMTFEYLPTIDRLVRNLPANALETLLLCNSLFTLPSKLRGETRIGIFGIGAMLFHSININQQFENAYPAPSRVMRLHRSHHQEIPSIKAW
jgi:hypothetical protein